MKILITGGAGFIGSALAEKLADKNEVVVLDNLSEQIHGDNIMESYLYKKTIKYAKILKGDIRNRKSVYEAIQDVDYIYHLAAETGTGQSMYDIHKYYDVNVSGSAMIGECLYAAKEKVKKIILISSRAVYGEGKYYCKSCGDIYPKERNNENMYKGIFDPVCSKCASLLEMRLTDEVTPLQPNSIYGFTKKNQEEIFSNICKTIGIPLTIFRLQNVYGPGQALKNPYTGILSIFSNLLIRGDEINIFEDGKESRDFVYINDVVDGLITGLMPITNNEIYNIGSGKAYSVENVVNMLSKIIGVEAKYRVTGNYRVGDIRHNIADIAKLHHATDYNPRVDFNDGLRLFVDWVLCQELPNSDYKKSLNELISKGLLK